MDLTTMSISLQIVWRAVGPDQIWLERHEPCLNSWVDESTPVGEKNNLFFCCATQEACVWSYHWSLELPHHRIANGVFFFFFGYVIIELSRWTRSNTNIFAQFEYELVTLSQKKRAIERFLMIPFPVFALSLKFKIIRWRRLTKNAGHAAWLIFLLKQNWLLCKCVIFVFR